MTVQRHDRAHPHVERTFTAVRATLPAANVAAFDTITHAPVVNLAAHPAVNCGRGARWRAAVERRAIR